MAENDRETPRVFERFKFSRSNAKWVVSVLHDHDRTHLSLPLHYFMLLLRKASTKHYFPVLPPTV